MKCKLKFLLIVLMIMILPNAVSANSITTGLKGGTSVFSNYGISTGVSNNNRSGRKVISGTDTEVYCARYEKGFLGGKYTICKSQPSEDKMMNAAEAISLIDGKKWATLKGYAYKVAVVNKILGLSGNGNFSGGTDWKISDIKKKAESNDDDYPLTNADQKKAFKTITHSISSGNMKALSSSGQYISEGLTFNGLKKKVGGATPVYTFSVSGGVSASNVSLCTTATGFGCTPISDVSISGLESLTYYVKVSGVTSSTNFSITINGSVKFSYKSGVLYCQNSMQPLFLPKSKSTSITASDTVNFSLVTTKEHQIQLIKVDEYGAPLANAKFSFTFGGAAVNLTDNGNGLFTYSANLTDDQFYGKQFCYTETTVPNGYIKDSNTLHGCYTIENKSSKTCYYIGDPTNPTPVNGDKLKYCDSNIKFYCKKTATPYKDEVTTIPAAEEGGEPTTTTKRVLDTEHVGNPTYSVYNDDECKDSDDENTEKVEAVRVCGTYNESSGFVSEDAKYCEDAKDYEEVTMNSGNVLIKKTNTTNTVKISKQDIVKSEEIPGAKLKICTEKSYNDAKNKAECEAAKTVRGTELSWTSGFTPMEFDALAIGTYYIIETLPPSGYQIVSTATKFTIDETGKITNGTTKNVEDNTVVINNEVNKVLVSKVSSTTSKHLSGATLAICEVNGRFFASEDNDSDNSSTTNDDSSSSTDGNSSSETNNSTSTSSESSNSSSDSEEASDPNVDAPKYKIKDGEGLDPNSLDLDMSGECIPVRLYDDTIAQWSTDGKEHKVDGLPMGTYYLVEKVAPLGYSTANSILFTMNADGTITDKDGKLISGNKIVMKDVPIKDAKTGILPIVIISGLGLGSIGGIGYAYHKSTVKHLPRRRKIK